MSSAAADSANQLRSRVIEGSAATDAWSETAWLSTRDRYRHAFIQNIRRGHYELGDEETVNLRILTAFDELVRAI